MVQAIFPAVPDFFPKFHLYLRDAPFPKIKSQERLEVKSFLTA